MRRIRKPESIQKRTSREDAGEHIRPELVVEKAKRLGVTLGLCAEGTDLAPFEGLPESVSAQIRAHKSEIVGHLRNEAAIARWLSEHAPRSPNSDDRCLHCGAGADGPDLDRNQRSRVRSRRLLGRVEQSQARLR